MGDALGLKALEAPGVLYTVASERRFQGGGAVEERLETEHVLIIGDDCPTRGRDPGEYANERPHWLRVHDLR
ncbi:hypothetical protein [Haloarchaeobius sp. TZWSO28]|uniref:hypothetical protein n=1 Tax=Haloarchaeobius sp. TZWSO28 TaxID=3446119 RepID=UPI003EB73CF4